MHQRLSPSTVFLLVVPPLLWACNTVTGRLVTDLVPPMSFNLLRWLVAFAVMLPLGHAALRRGSPMWRNWRYYAVLGLCGIGTYNALLYLALHTTQPLNVTLVGSGLPVWMLLVGRLFFREPVRRTQVIGAALSIAGVLTVLSQGSLQALAGLRVVPGDGFVVLATIAWAFYSWLIAKPPGGGDALRGDWALFLTAQIFFGVLWAGLFTAAEWTLGKPEVRWSPALVAAIVFVGIFPAVVAYRCFGAGVQRAGPAVAAFFVNLNPVFTALLAAAILGDMPRPYHAAAFLLIVAGIAISSKR